MQSLLYFCTLSRAKNPTMCSQTIECCVGVLNWSSQLQLNLFYGASQSFFVNKTKTEQVRTAGLGGEEGEMAVWIVLNPIIRMFRLKNCILGQALMVNLFRFLTLFSSSHPWAERIGIGTSGWSLTAG